MKQRTVKIIKIVKSTFLTNPKLKFSKGDYVTLRTRWAGTAEYMYVFHLDRKLAVQHGPDTSIVSDIEIRKATKEEIIEAKLLYGT